MDNRLIDITSEGKEALKMALSLIWDNAPGGKATHFRVLNLRQNTTYNKTKDREVGHHLTGLVQDDEKGTPTLILYWKEDRAAQILPYPMELDSCYEMVLGWLAQADYGFEPGHDGSNGKGFRVLNEMWGHVIRSHYAFAAIQPCWAWYGK